MMLGFISLMLVITRDSLAKICVPDILSDYMLPCGDGNRSASYTGSGGVNMCSKVRVPFFTIDRTSVSHII